LESDVFSLESSIKRLPDVLGCVILTHEGEPSEIQAFTRSGTDRVALQKAIFDEVAAQGFGKSLRDIMVFELEAESIFGDRETLERAAELAEQEARARGPVGQEAPDVAPRPDQAHAPITTGMRPLVLSVGFFSTALDSKAEVSLAGGAGEAIGEASGEKTPHGLKVLSEATLEAVSKLTGRDFVKLVGASLVSIVGEEAVLVMVREPDGQELLGAALVHGGPVPEAAVKATLDAINRRLAT
jgi:hypothetical protein